MFFLTYLILSLRIFYPNSNYNYKQIGGYSNIKSEINEVMNYLQDKNDYKRDESQIGIILEGPSGIGKTYFGKCLAGEYNCSVLACSIPDIIGSKMTINDVFNKTHESNSKILFLDELDILNYESNPQLLVLNQLINKLDGIEENLNLLVIGTTRDISLLDPILIRPGRFDKHLKLLLPDDNDRREIINLFDYNNLSLNKDKSIITMTKKMTAAQIKMLFREANRCKFNSEPVTMEKLQLISNYINNGQELSKTVISRESFIKICYHEVGHALISIKSPNHPNPNFITVENLEDGVGGLTSYSELPESLISYRFLIERICVLLAGRAAEEIMFSSDISIGAVTDIDIARKLAIDMICKYAFIEDKHRVKSFISDRSKYELDKHVETIMDNCYQISLSKLKEDIPLLLRITKLLCEKKTLSLELIVDNMNL